MSYEATRATLEREARPYRYFRDAVERHWDPAAVDLSADVEGMGELDDEQFEGLRAAIAKFGAGEEAVADDLAPLSVVLDDPAEVAFLTSQLYEEAKHADFFDRYWREVVNAAERERGLEPSAPGEERWFGEAYDELFGRNEAAMERLLVEDTPETRAVALAHYHLTIEGILAQTAYYGLGTSYGPKTPELPDLPGLTTGLDRIRRDEGRHVGFGMVKLAELVEGGVDEQLLYETVDELLPMVDAITTGNMEEEADEPGPGPDDLREYATGKHVQRMNRITDADATVPDVESLVALDD